MRILISTLLLLLAITTLFATTRTHQQEIPQLTSSNVDFCQSIVDNFLMFRPTATPPPTTRAPAAIATQSTTTTSSPTTTSTPITTTSTATTAVNTTPTSVQPDTVAENANDNDNNNKKNDLMIRRELALDLLNDEDEQGQEKAVEDQNNNNNKNDFVETSLQPPSVTAPQPTLPPVRVPIFPITYKISSHLNSVFQADVISRLKQVSQNGGGAPQLGPQPPQGSSFTAQYRFFQSLAFATQGLDTVIRNFEGTSIWADLISKFSSSSSTTTTKPYILNIQNIINQVVSSNSNNNNQQNSVWGFNDVSSQTGATFSDIRERLAVGFLAVVALQSNNRQNAMCSGFLQKVSSPPWPLVQSRTILSIVVGIDTSFIYLSDPCSNEIAKLELEEFSQRWHNFEVTNDEPTVPVSVVRRVMYFSVANVTQSMMRVVKQNYAADDIFGELSVNNVRNDI